MLSFESAHQEIANEIIQSEIDSLIEPFKPQSNPFWENLKSSGSSIWLDTGDLLEASAIWSSEMSGLTTNNSLLNSEIQKGIYDEFIKIANSRLKDLHLKARIQEIAFILNARHGLILSRKFGCKVSVELHTDFAHDVNAIVSYGKRFYEINPEKFLIKVPYTPSGLIGARILHENNVPVNFTLQFSARQNLISTVLAKPAYNNVFLGRIGAYLKNNELGSGKLAGEKTCLSAQQLAKNYSKGRTSLIAASIRSAEQLEKLSGIDVLTIPVKVAKKATSNNSTYTDNSMSDYIAELYENINNIDIKIEKLWDISDNEQHLIDSLIEDAPENAEDLIVRTRIFNCFDLFPVLSDRDLKLISADGKIPVHAKWKDRIRNNEIAIDTLLNLAGLASFTSDQAALDKRIASLIT